MKITWVTRSFADYRIPVYKALDQMCGHELTVIYYNDACSPKAQEKLRKVLGERAIARTKELRFGNGKKLDNATTMKSTVRIPISPGLVRQILHTRPDVLISDGFMQWTYAPLIVRIFKHIPHVMCYERTAHTERRAGKLRIFYRRFVSRWIDAIDCNGELCGNYVKQLLGWTDDRLTYGHMVADVDGMAIAVQNRTADEVELLKQKYHIRGIVFLFVGQLIDRKGVMELLMAWNSFKAQCAEKCTLIFVGTGFKEEAMRVAIENENIPDVVMTGKVDYDNISIFYKAADCFVLPTMEDNWSLVIPEAMACGLPVATTLYNGCYPELVTEKNGWIFDSMQQESIINTLRSIISCREKLKNMGEESKSIISCHSAENAAKGIMQAIYKVRYKNNR